MILAAQSWDWSVVTDNADLFLQGVKITVGLTVITMLLSLVGGLVLAVMRTSGRRALDRPAAAFVNFFRSVPLLLLLYWFFYVLPSLTGLTLSSFVSAVLGLTVVASAYIAETFRAGIVSIRAGQHAAALALGMSRRQVFVRVVFPQALRRVVPPLASIWVSLFKDTSLVSTIGVADLSYAAFSVRARTFRVFEVLTALAIMYLVLAWPQAKLTDWLHRRYHVEE